MVDFSEKEPGFSLGTPLPVASEASQKLLKLKSMERDLEIKDIKGQEIEVVSVDKILSEVDSTISTLEAQVFGIVESKANAQARMHEIDARKKQIKPFLSLPLPLELYSGYQSLSVFTGYMKSDPTKTVQESLSQYESLSGQGC